MTGRNSALSKINMDKHDAALINLLQDGLPLVARPFADVGEKLGISDRNVVERVDRLRRSGIFTRFGPFFDASAMGGAFCLCAMAVPQDHFDEVANLVNAHIEVAHNYERAHRLNMWFVLATQTNARIDEVVRDIERETGVKVLCFPKLEEFFIGFKVAA